MAQFRADKPMLEAMGVSWHASVEPRMYATPEFKRNYTLAMDALGMDAQPPLSTDPNSAVPAMLTTLIDPDVYKVLFSPNRAAEILGEVRKGSWLDDTAMFPIVEHEGEVTSYGDFNESGHAGANTNWPQRQAYLFQIVKEYGERELERAGLARVNWVSELDAAAATMLNKFSNLTYFYGVSGLQCYGLLNDPGLTAFVTPGTKAFGNKLWVTSGVVTATANEIFADIQTLWITLVGQNQGLVDQNAKVTLAMSPTSAMALTATNSFNVNVADLLKKNFPNIRIETAVQYGALTSSNPQGSAGGNIVQMIVGEVEGQKAGYCAYNEKMRAHPIIRAMSSFRQKVSGGSWGAIVRQPALYAQMIGV